MRSESLTPWLAAVGLLWSHAYLAVTLHSRLITAALGLALIALRGFVQRTTSPV
jgi:hypothetical protein